MRILIDECAPRALKLFLDTKGHECSTVQECGWSGTQNGELLRLANAKFEAFVTIDTNLTYEQNLTGLRISIIVIRAASNQLNALQASFPACAAALQSVKPGEVVFVDSPA